MRKFWHSTFTLIGVTVGAGVLGLPYVFAKSGIFLGIIELIIIGLVVCLISLYLGEVVLRTKGTHQLTELAHRYLGNTGKNLMGLVSVLYIYGALTAYSIGGGAALNLLFNIPLFPASLLFFFVFSAVIFFGFRIFEECEFILTSVIIGVLLLIAAFAFPSFSAQNLGSFVASNALLPYGVIMFAFLGIWGIVDMNQELKDKKQLKKSIIAGIAISGLIYVLFSIAVLGVTGSETTQVATLGLAVLGTKMVYLANLFAIFAMATSFIALGFALKETFVFDYKFKKSTALIATLLIPLILVSLRKFDFIFVINLAGTIVSALAIVLIVLMFHKAKKLGNRKPEYSIKAIPWLNILIIILFILGAVFTIIQSL